MSSWFSDLAGKAEAFLDRVDQATASTLQDAGIVKNTPKSNTSLAPSFTDQDSSQAQSLIKPVAQSLSYEPTASRRPSNSPSEKSQLKGATVAQVIVGSASDSPLRLKPKSEPMSRKELPTNTDSSGMTRTSSLSGLSSGTRTAPKLKTEESDDVLFEFLNTPTPDKARQVRTIRSTPIVKTSTATTGGTFGGEASQQVSSLPGPQLSPVKAQPSFSLSGATDGEKSQWDVGNIMTKSAHSQESHGKERRSEDIVGGKEQTDGHFEAKGATSTTPTEHQSVERDKSVPLDSETKEAEMNRHSDVSDSRLASLDAGQERQNQPQSNADQTLLAELRQKVSNLELENKLLKREVASLNDEMGSLISRLNEASDSSSHYDRDIQSMREQVSQSDHVIRQLRSHDDDLQALLDARDQQIAVLRTQLAEGDRTAEQLRIHVSASQREKEQ